MEISKLKFPIKNRRLNFALRVLVIFIIFFLLAKYFDPIYKMGVFSNHVTSIVIVLIVWLYRFISYAVVPGIIFLLLVDYISNKIKK